MTTKTFEIPGVPDDYEDIVIVVRGTSRHITYDENDVRQVTLTPFEEKFIALPTVPAAAMMDLVNMIQWDEDGNRQIDAGAVSRYMAIALEPRDALRFLELISDPVRVVPTQSLADIAMWLAAEQAGRPTEPSST